MKDTKVMQHEIVAQEKSVAIETITQTKRVFENVGLLDLTAVQEATLASVESFGNIGVMLTSPATAAKVAARTHLSLVVAGELRIAADVTPEEIACSVEKFYLLGLGRVECSGSVASALKVIATHLAGTFLIPGEKNLAGDQKSSVVINSRLEMGTAYVRGLKDNTEIVVNGKMRVLPELVDAELFAKKVSSIKVNGKLIVPEEKVFVFERLAHVNGKLEKIESGCSYFDQPLELDRVTIQGLPGRKIHCAKSLQVCSDVDEALLKASLDRIIVKDVAVVPANLK